MVSFLTLLKFAGFRADRASMGVTRTAFSASPSLEHFVADRFSMGGTAMFGYVSSTRKYTEWSIGPSATYHFFASDRWTSYIGVNPQYNTFSFSGDFNTVHYLSVLGKVGFNYFLTPSVALGPALSYTHGFSNTSQYVSYIGYNQIDVLVSFGVYL